MTSKKSETKVLKVLKVTCHFQGLVRCNQGSRTMQANVSLDVYNDSEKYSDAFRRETIQAGRIFDAITSCDMIAIFEDNTTRKIASGIASEKNWEFTLSLATRRTITFKRSNSLVEKTFDNHKVKTQNLGSDATDIVSNVLKELAIIDKKTTRDSDKKELEELKKQNATLLKMLEELKKKE